MSFVSCAKLNAEVAALQTQIDEKQGELQTCDGAPLPAGTKVATCDDLDAAIAGIPASDGSETKLANGTNTTVSGSGTAAAPYTVNVSAADILAAVPDASTSVRGLVNTTTQSFAGSKHFMGPVTGFGTASPARKVEIESTSPWIRLDQTNGVVGGTLSMGLEMYAGATAVGGLEFETGGGNMSLYNTAGGTLNIQTTAGLTTWINGAVVAVHHPQGLFLGGNGAAASTLHVNGTTTSTAYVTTSDETLKEDVTTLDPTVALAFRNGLKWKRYELFSEEAVEIMEDVVTVDEEGKETTTQKGTGRYEIKRHSQGYQYGLIAQDVQALTKSLGAFEDVVVKVGEYFTVDKDGYPVKDNSGNVIMHDRLGLNYDTVNVIVMAAEQQIKADPNTGALSLETV